MEESVLFIWCAMFSVSHRSFSGTWALGENNMRHLVLEFSLTGPGCSAAVDLSIVFPFFEVGANTTGMILPFGRMIVHYCTGSVLASDSATVTIFGRAGGCDNAFAKRGN